MQNSAASPLRPKKSRLLWRRIKKHFPLYLFILPTFIYFAIFYYQPMYGLQIAFRNYNPALGIMGSRWVGLKHIQDFVTSYNFWPIMRNTLTISIYSMLAGFPIPILLALLLNEVHAYKYKKTMQTILYAPHFISTVVMCGMIVLFLSPSIGIINHLLEALGFERQYFMVNPLAFKHIYVWSGVWQGMGWSAIIYLAALSSVDPTLHEAAVVDGASRFQRVLHINIPIIRPTIVILLIMNIGSLVNVGFEKTFLLQNNLNLGHSEVISTYVYRRAFLSGSSNLVSSGTLSFSSAIGLFNNLINVILLLLANGLARRVGETSLF